MTDDWKVICYGMDDISPIGEITPMPNRHIVVHNPPTSDKIVTTFLNWEVPLGIDCKEVGRLRIYRNNVLFAKLSDDRTFPFTLGSETQIDFVVYDQELVAGSNHRISDPFVCTCGGWSVYGKDADLHGNYCDLRTL